MYDENSNASTTTAVSSASVLPGSALTQPSSALVSQLLNGKDSRWLQVEVCREFQRGQCTRSDQECKFAHPPPHVDVQQGRVTACYDSIKGRCTRENPKCKYLHPPQHIKDQLLINGRNNLALKNLLCSQINQTTAQPIGAPTMNPLMTQLMAVQQQAASQGLAAATGMVPTLAYPYYQHLIYPQQLIADPYQQLQQAAGLQMSGVGIPGHQPSSATALQMALLQQQQQQAVAVAAQQALLASSSRKRPLEEEPTSSPVDPSLIYNLAAGVPVKRAAVDKSGGGAASQQAMLFSAAHQASPAQTQAAQQPFSPYILQGIHGYVPTVNFNGQAGGLPPRF
ncbi:unnamed protein product, partial [Mesorhabditis belari]|uniref:Muscleblind-like protein n=1 Tax=Mesorhabditis belari TaxID=2138241 RepID=A0AAF3FL86_9BILA